MALFIDFFLAGLVEGVGSEPNSHLGVNPFKPGRSIIHKFLLDMTAKARQAISALQVHQE